MKIFNKTLIVYFVDNYYLLKLPSEDYLKVMSPPLTPSERASTSCPSDLARLKKMRGLNLTEDELRQLVKDRHKKDTHNISRFMILQLNMSNYTSLNSVFLQETKQDIIIILIYTPLQKVGKINAK